MDNKVLKSIKAEAPEPPDIPSVDIIPSSIAVIWVTDEYLPKYLEHPVWGYFAPIMKPLSQYDTKYIQEVGYTIGCWSI